MLDCWKVHIFPKLDDGSVQNISVVNKEFKKLITPLYKNQKFKFIINNIQVCSMCQENTLKWMRWPIPPCTNSAFGNRIPLAYWFCSVEKKGNDTPKGYWCPKCVKQLSIKREVHNIMSYVKICCLPCYFVGELGYDMVKSRLENIDYEKHTFDVKVSKIFSDGNPRLNILDIVMEDFDYFDVPPTYE